MKKRSAAAGSVTRKRNAAVIDVGSSAIRMEIAEIAEDGSIRVLDELSHATNLGRDVFTHGAVQQETIEECVTIFDGYRAVMEELGVRPGPDFWAVGTSAVREAQNRDTFIDRISSATGIEIEPLAISEIHRINYDMLKGEIDADPALSRRNVVILEIGGGLTEILVINKGRVVFAGTYPLGLLRIQQEMVSVHATADSVEAILHQHLMQIEESFLASKTRIPRRPILLAISGDARFATRHVRTRLTRGGFWALPVDGLEAFSQEVIRKPVEDVAAQYNIPVSDAESLAPSLMCYIRVARFFQTDEIHVTRLNFRHGMLRELAKNREWSEDFEKQVLFSAVKLGEKFAFDPAHAECVAAISVRLFREMAGLHRLGRKYELLLRVAAILHDIGFFISNRSHHKHSFYIIQNSELFGIPDRDRQLVAATARYHRRTQPRESHEEYRSLERTDRLIVGKLAAMLRIADALDRNHRQQAANATFEIRNGQLRIGVAGIDDPTTERIALKQKGQMFIDVFGLRLHMFKGAKVRETRS
jgi:exopolyphosphatase/guanosine-5'-triphosphate,3'-diphosphate pyrophosphatase